MSYVAKTLAQGERIVHRARFNWIYSFGAYFWLALGIAPLLVNALLGYLTQMRTLEESTPLLALSGLALPLGFGVWLKDMVYQWTTEIVVTSQRFVYKTGLIARQSKEVSLSKIEEINLSQSIWGRIFGYGRLIIRGTGVGVLELPPLDDPVAIRRCIQDARSAAATANGE